MDAMLTNNQTANKRSRIKDFLVKINNKTAENKMPDGDHSLSKSAMAQIVQHLIPVPSQQHRRPMHSTFDSNRSEIPCSTILDELRELNQQKQQLEELQQEGLFRSQLSALRSQLLLQQQQDRRETLALESMRKQNAMLWEWMKRCEWTIKNLEENQSKLSQANAKLKVELQDQFEMNKNLVQRNTDIVLDASAKDQQIAVLKEQKKCLTKQNIKLKSFLQKTDTYLESLQSQQYLLQQRQDQMQQNIVTDDSSGRTSASKKRKRDNPCGDECNNDKKVQDEGTICATNSSDVVVLDDNDRDVITVSSSTIGDETEEVVDSSTNSRKA